MRRSNGLLLLTCAAAVAASAQEPPAPGPYEEPLSASQAVRKENYDQLLRYIDRLVDGGIPAEPAWSHDYSSTAAYGASAESLRAALALHLGYPSPGAEEAKPVARREQVGEDDAATYYRMWVTALPECPVYGLYIVPKGGPPRKPLVIAQHGGGGFPELATYQGGGNYHDLVRGAVARGWVVWAPALLFNPFGEQSGLPEGVRQLADRRARRAGTTLTAIEVTKLSLGLTGVLAEPEVDGERVAMAGLSYGGYYTLMTAALEPRIRCAVSSCWFNDRNAVFRAGEPFAWDDAQFLGAGVRIRDADLVALICPRPLQVQVGAVDDLFPVAGADREALLARVPYDRLGLSDRFDYRACEGGHEFFGGPAWEFLGKWL